MAMNEGYHTVFGVDRSGDRLIVFRLRRRAGRVMSAAEWTAALARADHPRTALAVALPVRDSLVQWIRAPFPSMSKARRVFPSLLDAALPFPVERCTVQFLQECRDAEGGVEALALAVRHETLDALLEEWGAQRVDPEWVVHEGWALWAQALVEQPAAPGRMRVIGHWTDDRLVLAVGRGDRLEGAYNVGVDAGEGAPALAPAAARIRRLLRARWEKEGEAGWEWGWSGTRAVNPQDTEALLRQVDPPEGVRIFVLDQPETFLARALALQLAPGREGRNFRTPPREHPKTVRHRRRRSVRAALMLTAVGIGLCLVNLGAEHVARRRDAEAQERLAGRVRALTGAAQAPRGMERHAAEQYMQENRDNLERLQRFFEPSAGFRLGVVLELAEAGDLFLNRAALDAGSVELRGSAADPDRLLALRHYLEEEGYDVEIEHREDPGGARRGFVLRGVRHGG